MVLSRKVGAVGTRVLDDALRSSAMNLPTPQLFRLRDELESNLLRSRKARLRLRDIGIDFRILAPPVALSGIVADSHVNP